MNKGSRAVMVPVRLRCELDCGVTVERDIDLPCVPSVGWQIKAGRGGTMDYLDVTMIQYSESDDDGRLVVWLESSESLTDRKWFEREGWRSL